MKLSAIVITKNEEDEIGECLGLLGFVDEIVIVDDNSIDNTRQIARGMGARTFKRSLDDDYSAQRNFGLTKAKGEWVLFVDADERVEKTLADEILKAINTLKVDGFELKRRDTLWGREIKHGESRNTWLVRLGRRGSGSWRRSVHEVWEIEGEIGKLDNLLYHHPHKSLSEFMSSINYYSGLHARENQKEGKRSDILKIIFYPAFKFIDSEVLKLGMLDGMQGHMIAFMMSFHSFLSWSKLWIYQRKD